MTDYSSFYSQFIKKIFYTADAGRTAAVERALSRLPGISAARVDVKVDIPAADRRRTTLFLTAGRGSHVGACPGSRGHLCCNYLTVNLYEGCPIGCTYCIMQSYLNFLPVTVNVDTDAIRADIERVVALNPGRSVRLGTGEVGDSLFYDPLFELSRGLLECAAQFPNVSFELKTKTSFVEHLLDIEPKGGAVIGFSLNPPSVIAAEEGAAAGLEERLAAAARAAAAGFRLAFHFDPIIRVPDWETLYTEVVDRLEVFPAPRIAWVSLGTVRYPGELKNRMAARPYLYDEFFRSRDGKFRYLQPIRTRMYRVLAERIARRTGAPVYLCMESPAVWERVFGELPAKNEALCAIFSGVKLPHV